MTDQNATEIRQFRATSLRDALDQIRAQIGPDAEIIRTREVPKPGFWNRLWGHSEIEITAGTKPKIRADARIVPLRRQSSDSSQGSYTEHAGVELELSSAGEVGAADDRTVQESLARLRQVMQPRVVTTAAPATTTATPAPSSRIVNWPESCFELYNELLDADLDTNTARELVSAVLAQASTGELSHTATMRSRLRRHLSELLPTSGPLRIPVGQQRVIALVGPTGVGKTTTIAKLAANSRLRDQRRVGLLTMDTYRIAAVEQLRTYAEIIDLPLAVVSNAQEAAKAMEQMRDLELIFIDTAGRSPRNEQQLRELQAMLQIMRPDETHLVQSCASSAAQLLQTTERFRSIGCTHLLMTKLDESLSLGAVVKLAIATGLPFSYLTTGQNVPDDIEIAESKRLVERIFELAQLAT